MKKLIVSLDKDWLAFLSGLIGILLIIFPEQLTTIMPWLLGITLVLHGITGAVVFFKYKDQNSNPGAIIIYVVLGAAILVHNGEAIGVIGVIWAVLSLKEVAEEITEAYREKHFSVFRMIMSLISVALAVMLLFDPFEHFEFHVRVLGLEMLSSVFVRRHNIIKTNK